MFGLDFMKQAKEMAERLKAADEELRSRTVESTVGGGVVTATCNGKLELVALRISPEVVDPEEIQMLEELVLSAVAEAQRRAGELAREAMGKAAGLPPGLDIPGLT